MIIVKNGDNYGEQLSKLVRKKLVNDDDASFSKEVFSFFFKRFLKTFMCSISISSFVKRIIYMYINEIFNENSPYAIARTLHH